MCDVTYDAHLGSSRRPFLLLTLQRDRASFTGNCIRTASSHALPGAVPCTEFHRQSPPPRRRHGRRHVQSPCSCCHELETPPSQFPLRICPSTIHPIRTARHRNCFIDEEIEGGKRRAELSAASRLRRAAECLPRGAGSAAVRAAQPRGYAQERAGLCSAALRPQGALLAQSVAP